MGVAKARLVQDINIRQLIQDLAVAWGDDEKKVLQYVANLFEEDYLKRYEEGVRFFYIHRLEATNTTGSGSFDPVRLPASRGGQQRPPLNRSGSSFYRCGNGIVPEACDRRNTLSDPARIYRSYVFVLSFLWTK